MLIQREIYMGRIRGFIDQPEIVKIITGLRRSGKSVMLGLIQQELLARGITQDRFLTYNFEDMGLRDIRDAEKLHSHLKAKLDAMHGRAYLFLDEIQEVEKWEACVNSLRAISDADIYVTGSNAKMLAGEYATLLAGRYVEIRLYPFSFQEFRAAALARAPGMPDGEAFKQYLRQGGMPFLASLGLSESDSKLYLQDIFASVVIKDIIKRYRFREVELLERIIAYALENIGRTFSAASISRFLKSERRTVSPETILSYLKACEEAYLLTKIKRLDVPGKKTLQVNEKYYLADHGIREAVYGDNERDIELVLENIVCLELLRRGYKVFIGRVGEKEIDFVCEIGDARVYVQVCYLLAGKDAINREFGAYYDVPDNYPKYVVSMDEIDMSRDGIKHMNIRDFLLAPSY